MKKVVYTKYGSSDVLQEQEVSKPVPKEDEVLIRIFAASINSRDWRFMRANPFFIRFTFGYLKPNRQILGADLAGIVEAIGSKVTQYQLGDAVFGCLFDYDRSTFAEYVCAKEDEIAFKPDNLTFEQAAAVPLAAMTALQALHAKGNIQAGQKVLIYGASGGVGSFAVQIAKSFGADVTAVCSTRNIEMVRSLGADHVIDYKKERFSRNGQRYDLIVAVNGYNPISDYLHSLSPEGVYVESGGTMVQLFQATLNKKKAAKSNRQKTEVVSLTKNPKDLLIIKELLESGKVTPVIDSCYPLGKIADAMEYYEKVHPAGKIVITVEQSN